MTLLALTLCATPGLTAKVKVHTIGDSTMQTYDPTSYPVQRGWGQLFQQFFDPEQVTVNNRGKAGASSKSFYEEAAYWQSVKKQIEPGDYVIIQFAHNDEKSNGTDGDELKAYYTALGDATSASSTDYRGTTASGTYRKYIRAYIEETRALGATPIVVGSMCRNYWDGGKIRRNGRHDLGDNYNVLRDGQLLTGQKVPADDHTYDYPYQSRLVAEEMGVAYLDLTTECASMFEKFGQQQTSDLIFTCGDGTHPNGYGATLIGRLCAQLMQKAGILTDAIRLTSDLSVSPATGDMGDAYKGQVVTKEFQLSGFDLSPARGSVTITASAGLELSTDRSSWGSSLSLSYEGGNMIDAFYARCEYRNAGELSEQITIESSGKTIVVPVTGNCIVLEGGTPAQAYWRLEKNDEATVDGPISALGQSFSDMYVQRYSNPNANTTWPDWTGFEATRKTQRCLIEGDAWPAGEIDEVSTRYIEFAVQPAKGTSLAVDSISFFVCGCGGNGMRSKIYYSKEADFANPVQMASYSSMPANTMLYTFVRPVLTVVEGEILRLRVYPWYNGAATGKTICLSDVTFHGMVSDNQTQAIQTLTTPAAATTRYNLLGQQSSNARGMTIMNGSLAFVR